MKKTDQPASLGAKMSRATLGPVGLVCLVTFSGPLAAQDYANGQQAYEQRDWTAAQRLWEAEAAAGSAEARLGLGNLYDFGLLGARDPERAFDLYLSAAEDDLPEAAFNVAVMYDSGVGAPQDLEQAAAWYSFAAIGGHGRSAYNLGQLFDNGEGVQENSALAAYWYDIASPSIPSARGALAELSPSTAAEATTELSAPQAVGAHRFTLPDGIEVRFAWQALNGPADAAYQVELLGIGDEGYRPLGTVRTSGSAAAVDLPELDTPFAWRVSQVKGDRYAASDWTEGNGGVLESSPVGTVRFSYDAQDRRAEGLAYRMGGAMERFGALVLYQGVATPVPISSVTYGYWQDARLATDIATFLPGLASEGAELLPDQSLTPGEIRVSLSFTGEGTQP